MLARFLSVALLSAAVGVETSIHKVDYPELGFCGEEQNVTKSTWNPHYFFPMHFGNFREGPCSLEGYTVYEKTELVDMHPFLGVHHKLTFLLYSRPNTKARIQLMEWVDPARKNRTVSAKVCIPPNHTMKKWPLLIYGHGFDCRPEDYAYTCKEAITAMVFHRNVIALDEGTKDLAVDAVFLSTRIPLQATQDASAPFYNMLDGLVVLGGHSMGGGTSILAAAEHPPVAGMALFAPGLYTIPPANPYLKDVKTPTLIVSGSDDCGPNQLPKQAQPAFDGLASQRKVLVSLTGANHCQWAAPSKGEIGVCSMPFFKECALIDASAQQALGVELLGAFFIGLRSDQGWESFEQTLMSGERNGTWTYFSSKTSSPNKTLHNDCPCKKNVNLVI